MQKYPKKIYAINIYDSALSEEPTNKFELYEDKEMLPEGDYTIGVYKFDGVVTHKTKVTHKIYK